MTTQYNIGGVLSQYGDLTRGWTIGFDSREGQEFSYTPSSPGRL